MGIHKYISWETPPERGVKFTLYITGNRMMMFNCITEFQEDQEKWLKGDQIQGWKAVDVRKDAPPFLQPQIHDKLKISSSTT